jgi:hypothetical protein
MLCNLFVILISILKLIDKLKYKNKLIRRTGLSQTRAKLAARIKLISSVRLGSYKCWLEFELPHLNNPNLFRDRIVIIFFRKRKFYPYSVLLKRV